MAVDPVSQRFAHSGDKDGGAAWFASLSNTDKTRVVNAKINDQIIQPLMNKAISNSKAANEKMSKALKGENS